MEGGREKESRETEKERKREKMERRAERERERGGREWEEAYTYVNSDTGAT